MKIFYFFSFFLLIIKISSQIQNNTDKIKLGQNNINNQKNITSQNQTNEENIIKNSTKKLEEKLFNLTESLINFFKETFTDKNETKKDSWKINKTDENIRKKLEEEKQKKLREEQENKAKLEKIKIETQKKKEKLKQYEKERDTFTKILVNNTFKEVIQINLQKGESETLYLDLQAFSKIKLAIMVSDSDQDEKVNLFFSGPNARGHTTVIQNYYSKNFLFWEFEVPRNGEYYAEITNKGTKDNEIYFLFNDMYNKKNDKLDTQKIDKISMLLNDIDNNMNQLRNKKRLEIKQVNSHNDKVSENNKWIVIYSVIEIFTMIMVFIFQSCYINSLVNKV